MKIAILGSGSWGTALSNVLADNGLDVNLWSLREDVSKEINSKNTNSKYLPNIKLNPNIKCSTSLKDVLIDSKYILIVVPSHAMREVVRKTLPHLRNDAVIIHATKGIEVESLKRMSEVLKEILPSIFHDKISVLSGPSHAEEVVLKKPTTLAVSTKDLMVAKDIQKIFSNHYFRVYTNVDVVGVELGGSLKNIIALAGGIVDGLELGDNAKAALLTRGLAEIVRLGIVLGANPMTFSGLTGIGDLIVTGTSTHSRNWKTGNMLAQGKSLNEALSNLGMVAEGVKTTKAAYLLSKELNIDMPITQELYYVLFEQKCPEKATTDLMSRNYKSEEI